MPFTHKPTDDFDNPSSVKFLGIHLDPKLNWSNHVDYLSKKLTISIYVIRNITKLVPIEVINIRDAYFAIFQSLMTYGFICWGHTSKAERIFKLQRRVLCIKYV